jgi:carboxyvinyl-carboxyphosphonate phosphorylmutase
MGINQAPQQGPNAMQKWSARRARFRELISSDKCYHPGSVFDPMSARMAEHVGYEMGMFAGSTASMTVLGAPDHIVITLSEFAAQCLRINRAFDLPLMVDADHGYGNALSVMRTVEELEIAGVSGMSIEDTELPQSYGMNGRQRLLSLDEGVGKMKAAVAARADKNGIAIAGRTSAVAIAGIEDAIKRVRAYQETGVDAIFLVGVTTREQLDAIAPEIKLPLILGGTPAELKDPEYLASRGARIALQGHHPIRAAVQAVYATMRAMRDGAQPGNLENMPSKELLRVAMAEDAYDDWMKKYI